MITEIQSIHNPRVKEWAQLLERKGRDKQGKYLIEGLHLVEEAVQAKAPIKSIVYSMEKERPHSLYEATKKEVEWIAVTEAVMGKCSDTQTPQGIFAVLDKGQAAPEHFVTITKDLVVIIDGVQDPGNLGTIIRSADAVGAAGVLLGKGTVDLYNPKTIRSTMGSLFHLPIVECDLLEILPAALELGLQIVNTSLQAKQSCYETDFRKPTWFIVGNEGQGVSPQVASLANHQVIIPMQGQAESLNAAMAATVLLFEASRQRLM